jgi:hypothetical protein
LAAACSSAALADVPGSDACAIKSLRTVAGGFAKEAQCWAREALKPSSFTPCVAKFSVSLAATLQAAGGCAFPATVADLHACSRTMADALPRR